MAFHAFLRFLIQKDAVLQKNASAAILMASINRALDGCVHDVTPDGVVGKHRIIATIGSDIIMSGANNITFEQAKTSFFFLFSLTARERDRSQRLGGA